MAGKSLVGGFKLSHILAMHLKGAINIGPFVGSSLKATNGTRQERSFKSAERKRQELKTSAGAVPFGGAVNITLL
jgi:hypothetical protein